MSIKKVIILKPKKPLNFSESINIGIINSSNKKIFIANDDIIISKNTLEVLFDRCDPNTISGPDSNCNLGWISEKCYTVGGIPLVPTMSLDQVKDIIPEIYKIKPNAATKKKEMSWLAFFATMIHRETFKEVGLLDENFVYDKEDLDWCLRASRHNKKFIYCYDSYCFHFGGVSRKIKHAELGMKHLEDNSKNEKYFNNKYKENKPILGFYAHDAWEFWDENSLNNSVQDGKPNGIGGSETQAILLNREISKLGYSVKIFNKCKMRHYDSGGYDVEYIPFHNLPDYSKNIEFDIFIASRYLDCFNFSIRSKLTLVMIHDIFLIMNKNSKYQVHLDKVDKYLCLCNSHKKFVSEYHHIPLDKILITSNGLDFSRFEDNIEKDPYQLIYSSSPDRGLELLLSLFPKIKEKVPQAKLDIFYGFENFQDQVYIKKIMNLINTTEGVTYHGRVGQDELARAFKRSTIWAYPTWFQETFCITALEAMAGGCVPVTSNYWGLTDTIKEGGILLPMHNDASTVHTSEYQTKWVEECVRLLIDKEYLNYWQKKGKERIKRFTWEEVARQWVSYFKNKTWKEIQ